VDGVIEKSSASMRFGVAWAAQQVIGKCRQVGVDPRVLGELRRQTGGIDQSMSA
jgi:hypothetical protein